MASVQIDKNCRILKVVLEYEYKEPEQVKPVLSQIMLDTNRESKYEDIFD